MTTMAEVAREAGVSTTTVSHVLNGTRPVNKATTERVHAAIERTGYRPHSIARGLAGARTHSIGLAVSGIANPYLTDVIGAVEQEAAENGYTLLLGDTHDEPTKELQMVEELVLRRVDGVVLAPSPGADEGVLPYLRERSVPVVLLDRLLPIPIDQVGAENRRPTSELVAHLADLGHRRIGLVAGLEHLSTTEERIDGYRSGLEAAGLPVDPHLIAYGESQHESARGAAHGLLDLDAPPTALIAGNNAMTIGVLHALKERGLRVPDDIALVAFDDLEWFDLFDPRLTVVAQPTHEIGATAMRMLISRLDEPDKAPESIRLPTTFIHRDSCGCSRKAPSGDDGGRPSRQLKTE